MSAEYIETRLQSWRRLPRQLQVDAVHCLREKLDDEFFRQVRDYVRARPADWIAPFHLFSGMTLRNMLREAGLKDEMLPPSVNDCNKGDRNWDDYYVAVVEVAARTGIWKDLTLEERI